MATKTTYSMSQQQQPPFHYFEHYQEAHRPLPPASSIMPPIADAQLIRPTFVKQMGSPTTVSPSQQQTTAYFPNKPSVAVLNPSQTSASFHHHHHQQQQQQQDLYHSGFQQFVPSVRTMQAEKQEQEGFHPLPQTANYYYYAPSSTPSSNLQSHITSPTSSPLPSNYYLPLHHHSNFYSMYPTTPGSSGANSHSQNLLLKTQGQSGSTLNTPLTATTHPTATSASGPAFSSNSSSPSLSPVQKTSARSSPATASASSSSNNNNNNSGYLKITRNIRATRNEVCDEPVEFPQSGVLYEFNVENWTNKMNFYDKISYSFGVPSTQKVVFCHYLNCKVMHYERTCQGVYYCPHHENEPNVAPCTTVRPCRFRFQTCPTHQSPLKKSSNCKFKLHFYVPVDKEDHRRLLLCLGDHSHALLENDTNSSTTTSSSSDNNNSNSALVSTSPVVVNSPNKDGNITPVTATTSSIPLKSSPNREDAFSNFKLLVNTSTNEGLVLESRTNINPARTTHEANSNIINSQLPPISLGPDGPTTSVQHLHEDTTVYALDEQQANSSHLYFPMYHNLHSNSGSNSGTSKPTNTGAPTDFHTAFEKFNSSGFSLKRKLSSMIGETDSKLPGLSEVLHQQEQQDSQQLASIGRTEDKEPFLKRIKVSETLTDQNSNTYATTSSVNTPLSANREKLPSIKDLFNHPNMYQ